MIEETATTKINNKYNYPEQHIEHGWLCDRCGHVNAPWVRQCDCSESNWTITSDWTYKPEQWKEVTCNPDIFKIHPDTTTWRAPSSICQSDSATVAKANPNSITTAQNCTNPDQCHTPHYTTETVVNDCIHDYYNLRTQKETK